MLKLNSLSLSGTGLGFRRWMSVSFLSLIFLFCLQVTHARFVFAQEEEYFGEEEYLGEEEWGDPNEEEYYYEDLTWDDPLEEDLIGDPMEEDPLAVDLIGDISVPDPLAVDLISEGSSDIGDSIDLDEPAEDIEGLTAYDSENFSHEEPVDYGESEPIGEQEDLINS